MGAWWEEKGQFLTGRDEKQTSESCPLFAAPLRFHLQPFLTCSHPRLMLLPQIYQTSSRFHAAPPFWNDPSQAFLLLTHQDQLTVIFFDTLLSPQPAWLQPPNRICIRIDSFVPTSEAQTKVGSVVLPCWSHLHLGSACTMLCRLRYNLPSCLKQTPVPGRFSCQSHRDWVGERAARNWLPTKLQLAPKLSPVSRAQGFLTKICWKMDSQCFCLFT